MPCMKKVNKSPDTSATVLVKRKRGRPRKYPRPELDHGESVYVPTDPNLNQGASDHSPPGFGVNGNKHHQVDPPTKADGAMIGQVVHGVIEAAFDAGYLVTVRVGISETTLRGVVFKPGHYVPLSPDNDVAPGVPMIRRNELPLPTGHYGHVHTYPQSMDRNGTSYVAQAGNPVASRGKQISSVVMQTAPGLSRGNNVVPVVLQPVNFSGGGPLATVASQSVASKGKDMLDDPHTPNGATSTNQVFHFQPQNNHQVTPSVLPSGTVPFNQNPAAGLHGADAKSMALHTMPFETLLTEVMNRVQAPTQSSETNSSSDGKSSAKDHSADPEDDVSDSDGALSVEPLQAVQPGFPNQPVLLSRPLESYGPGKMTQLVQVLQENMPENHATPAEEQAAGPSRTLD